MFSLDEEDLTHYGQSLAEVDDFDQLDILSDSEDEDKEGECSSGGSRISKRVVLK